MGGVYEFLPRDRFLKVRPLLWSSAWQLAKLRTRSNGGRLSHRDRGKILNLRGDLVGAFGELLVYFYACENGVGDVVQYMKKTLFNPGGGGKLSSAGDAPGLDVKGFDFSPRKDFVAVNAEKHQKLKGEIRHYFFVFSPPLSEEVYTSSLIPWEEVSNWAEFSLGSYSDPSLNLDVKSFCRRYTPDLDTDRLRRSKFPAELIKGTLERGKTLLSDHLNSVKEFLKNEPE